MLALALVVTLALIFPNPSPRTFGQNVYSKTLLKYHTAVQLQFYATCSAMFVQIPFMVYSSWGIARSKLQWGQVLYLCVDGFFFYAQVCGHRALGGRPRPATRPAGQSASRPFGRSTSRLVGRSLGQPFGRSAGRPRSAEVGRGT